MRGLIGRTAVVMLLALVCGGASAAGVLRGGMPVLERGPHLPTLVGHLFYTTADGAEHRIVGVGSASRSKARTTFRFAGDDGAHAAVAIVRKTSWGTSLDLSITPAAGVSAVRLTLPAPATAHFLGTGERRGWVDLQRTVQAIKVWNTCGSAPSPFFASTAGFGAFVRGDPVGRIAFPGAVDGPAFACDLGTTPCSVGSPTAAVRICVKAAVMRVELYTGSVAAVVSRFLGRAGRPLPPWLPQFALMKWRDAVSGPAELYDDISKLRGLGLPIGWVILDNPWESGAAGGCFGSLTFDPSVYPDPAGMIARIHQSGVRFMLWVSPELKRKGCPAPPYPDGWLAGDDEYFLRDLTVPAERADFVSRLKALAALGVDGFKGDRGDEVDLERHPLGAGSAPQWQEVYPRLYEQAVAAAMAGSRAHWASLFRAAVPGSSAIVPGFFGGDLEHTWDGLLSAVRMAQTAAVGGETMWGSDIGGYDGGTITPDVFVRWAQFAALTPIFEVGGVGETATFWDLGSAAVNGFRAAATLHYELVPYLYELAQEASKGGLPPIRALGLTWPGDASAWRSDGEFTVGRALLAAPVVAAGSSSSVYLPAGTWIDFFTGRRLAGRRTVARASGADDFPLYVRAGSALAYDFRTPAVWPAAWRVDDLVRSDRQGWLVAPASGAAATAASGATRLVARVSGARVALTLTGAAPEQQLLVLPERPVCRVTVDGRAVGRAAAPSALAGAASGWAVDTARGAVVVKATVGRRAEIGLVGCR